MTDSWFDPLKWNPNGVPTASDIVNISSGYPVITSQDAYAQSVNLSGSGFLYLDGGSLTTQNFTRTGGVLSFSGGSLTVGNQNGGVFDMGSNYTMSIDSETTKLVLNKVSPVTYDAYIDRGTLELRNGTQVSNSSTRIGYNGSGKVVVTGEGSKLTTTGTMYVGYNSNGPSTEGVLEITNGGQVVSPYGSTVGSWSTGRVKLEGSGSNWQVGGPLYIGRNGSGSVEVGTGTIVSSGYAEVGYQGKGTATVAGTWTTDGIRLGLFVNAASTLTVQNGGRLDSQSGIYVNSGTFTVDAGGIVTGKGQLLTGVGTLAISGSLSVDGYASFSNNSVLDVRNGGTFGVENFLVNSGANIIIRDGGAFIANKTNSLSDIGSSVGGGTVTVESGGSLTNAGGLYVGNQVGSQGQIVIALGGTFQSRKALFLNGTVSGGGRLTVTEELQIGAGQSDRASIGLNTTVTAPKTIIYGSLENNGTLISNVIVKPGGGILGDGRISSTTIDTGATLSRTTEQSLGLIGEEELRIATGGAYVNTSQVKVYSPGSLAIDVGGIFTAPTTTIEGTVNVNGQVNSDVTVQNGGKIGGSGTVGTVSNPNSLSIGFGATLSPGNSPGIFHQNGDQTWGNGGVYAWQLLNADDTSASEAGVYFDQIQINGKLNIASSESPFTIRLSTLSATDTNGLALNFDTNQPYTWSLVTASDGIYGFSPSSVVVDASVIYDGNGTPIGGFQNNLNGGSFKLEVVNGIGSAQSLNLNFTPAPVPEPASVLAIGVGGLGLVQLIRRMARRSTSTRGNLSA